MAKKKSTARFGQGPNAQGGGQHWGPRGHVPARGGGAGRGLADGGTRGGHGPAGQGGAAQAAAPEAVHAVEAVQPQAEPEPVQDPVAIPNHLLQAENPRLVISYISLGGLFRLILESKDELEASQGRVEEARDPQSYVKQEVDEFIKDIELQVGMALTQMEKITKMGGEEFPIPEAIKEFFPE